MIRYMINQPSKTQPLHKQHGLFVLGPDSIEEPFVDVYPMSGFIVSMRVPRLCLVKTTSCIGEYSTIHIPDVCKKR